MKLLKKLSVSSLNNFSKGALKELIKGATAPVFVARILGSVRKVEVGTTQFGEFIAFSGEFRGWDIEGEEAMGVKAFLPSPLDEMLAAQVRDVQSTEGNSNKSVEFGADLFVVPDDTEVGYKYVIKPLLEAKASDPVAALAATVQPLQIAKTEALPALAAPSEEEQDDLSEAEKVPEGKPASKAKK